MRVFALSDVHVDYGVNARWVGGLSRQDYTEDLLILAGDVTDVLGSLEWCLTTLSERFHKVLFVPGNHELWVIRDNDPGTSLEKLDKIIQVAKATGVSMQPLHHQGMSIYPLLGWYDGSFGTPTERIRAGWMDYRACRWPEGFDDRRIAHHLSALNEAHIPDSAAADTTVITFSHFVPRRDIIPSGRRLRTLLHPVLGSDLLEKQLRRCHSNLHVFGHHHLNLRAEVDGVTYVNNAFGYPREETGKQLLCVHEC